MAQSEETTHVLSLVYVHVSIVSKSPCKTRVRACIP